MGKVIQLFKKENQTQEQRIKETAHTLIDLCEGDFAIVFKMEDMKGYFNNVNENKNFIIAVSDLQKIKSGQDETFKGFINSISGQYMDLSKQGVTPW
jgi:hypothetical protein